MSNKDSLGDRLKGYEDAYRIHLPNKLPIIIRLDGKGWHNYLKGCDKPFDASVIHCMNDTAIYLCKNIQGVKFCYLQSDEISLLIYNSGFESQGWFDNNIQKMVSVSSGLASSYFTSISNRIFPETKLAQFDARCFIVPLDEIVNAFIWRQQDATRNSVQMLSRSLYSHKECNNKNISELQELCFKKGINWNNLPTSFKRGRCITKQQYQKEDVMRSRWIVDNEIPIFSQDRNYIEKYI